MTPPCVSCNHPDCLIIRAERMARAQRVVEKVIRENVDWLKEMAKK